MNSPDWLDTLGTLKDMEFDTRRTIASYKRWFALFRALSAIGIATIIWPFNVTQRQAQLLLILQLMPIPATIFSLFLIINMKSYLKDIQAKKEQLLNW